ncbi:MIP/aquaporin family protein [Streptomyces sp. NPDC051677]|uniref:MIP/aquaporin family protein n=1 Tax=Streptomyces sp. NPDC051677 TaxID=3365669 RepID=UPI0037CD4E6C
MVTSTRVSARRATGTASGDDARGAGNAERPAAQGGTTARAAAAAEFALTGGVLFVLVTAVRWVMASPLSQTLPEPHLQLTVVAVIIGTALAWALSSPWGRYSGGHLNPAVTLALWVAGVVPGRRVLPYVAAQLAGSLAGTGLARLVWGPVVGDRMDYAAVRPAPALSAAALFTAEAAATAAILAIALLLMSRPAWTRWIPLALPLATAVVIVTLGTLTGGSANPARQFGPALWTHQPVYWSHLWIYLTAPLAGAALSALVTRYRAHRSRRSPRSGPARWHGRRSETDRCAAGSTC